MKLNIWLTEKKCVTIKQADVFIWDHDTIQIVFVHKNNEYTIKGKHPGECVEKLKQILDIPEVKTFTPFYPGQK